jgi:hypothetical protein
MRLEQAEAEALVQMDRAELAGMPTAAIQKSISGRV